VAGIYTAHCEADYWAQSYDCILHSTQSQAHCIAVKVAGYLVVYFSALCVYNIILLSCSLKRNTEATDMETDRLRVTGQLEMYSSIY